MKKRRFLIHALFCIYLFILAALVRPIAGSYEVKGVDVARYQGEVDWNAFSEQGIAFAFIKATEGSSHVDMRFQENWEAVAKTSILAAPYHFLSYDSSGAAQAEHYITTVGKRRGMLPPAVDVEFYGDYYDTPMEPRKAREILGDLLDALEKFYGAKPIIYATRSAYTLYIKDYFTDYPLWIRGVYYPPFLDGIFSWTFWQYSDRGRLCGHEGVHIDLNVYRGTLDELQDLVIK